MSNRQARRARVAALRDGDPVAKHARQETNRARAADVRSHNIAEENQRNRHILAHEREQSFTDPNGLTERPPRLRESGRPGHFTRFQMIALALAAMEDDTARMAHLKEGAK